VAAANTQCHYRRQVFYPLMVAVVTIPREHQRMLEYVLRPHPSGREQMRSLLSPFGLGGGEGLTPV